MGGIRIVDAEVPFTIFGDDRMIAWITKAHQKDIRIRMIAGPQIDPKTAMLLCNWIDNKVVEFHYSAMERKGHFIQAGDWALVEYPHSPFAEKVLALNINGLTPKFREKIEKKFDAIWKVTTPINDSTELDTLIERSIERKKQIS